MHFERQNFRIDCYKPKKHYGGKKLGLHLTKLINKDLLPNQMYVASEPS